MNSYLTTKYKMKNCTKEKLFDLDFKYDSNKEMFTTKFPVLKYRKNPVLFCELNIEEKGRVYLNILKPNGEIYAPWYAESSSHNELFLKVDRVIQNKFKELNIIIVDKTRKYKKKKNYKKGEKKQCSN